MEELFVVDMSINIGSCSSIDEFEQYLYDMTQIKHGSTNSIFNDKYNDVLYINNDFSKVLNEVYELLSDKKSVTLLSRSNNDFASVTLTNKKNVNDFKNIYSYFYISNETSDFVFDRIQHYHELSNIINIISYSLYLYNRYIVINGVNAPWITKFQRVLSIKFDDFNIVMKDINGSHEETNKFLKTNSLLPISGNSKEELVNNIKFRIFNKGDKYIVCFIGDHNKEITEFLLNVDKCFNGKVWTSKSGSYFTVNPINSDKIAFMYGDGMSPYVGASKDLYRIFPSLHEKMNNGIGVNEELDNNPSRVSLFIYGVNYSVVYTYLMRNILNVIPKATCGLSMGEVCLFFAFNDKNIKLFDIIADKIKKSRVWNTELLNTYDLFRNKWKINNPEQFWKCYLVNCTVDQICETEYMRILIVNDSSSMIIGGLSSECEKNLDKFLYSEIPYSFIGHCSEISALSDEIQYIHGDIIGITEKSIEHFTEADEKYEKPSDMISDIYTKTCNFPNTINKVFDKGYDVFIELGCDCYRSLAVNNILKEKKFISTSFNKKSIKQWDQILRMSAILLSNKIDINIDYLINNDLCPRYIDVKCDTNTVFWHPLNNIKEISFTQTELKPRNVCFVPFMNNPNDNNFTPGEYPLNWYNISEFCCGNSLKCFGENFAKYSNSNFPSFDLQLVTRVLSCNDTKLIAEFDCPNNAWFYNTVNDIVPYSILMEIALQACGLMSVILSEPYLKDKTDMIFRNLDARAEMLDNKISFKNKTLHSEVKNVSIDHSGNMIIHRMTSELSIDGYVFYKVNTVFGWFEKEVFKKQIGLDKGACIDPLYVKLNYNKLDSIDYNQMKTLLGNQRHVQMQLLDNIDLYNAYIYSSKKVDPDDWFFSCHFWNDPVMPGSLGVEAMFQMLEIYAIKNNLTTPETKFSYGNGIMEWKYRGQLTRTNNYLNIEISNIIVDNNIITGKASLFVDGLRIYEVKKLILELINPKKCNNFMTEYNVKYPLYVGAMAKGISSVDLVKACSNNGILSFFGAGGLQIDRLEESLQQLSELNTPYGVNFLHNPFNENIEKETVNLLVKYNVKIIEAAAFMSLTESIVKYRALNINNKIIAKVSRTEIAEMYMKPAPVEILEKLLNNNEITQEQLDMCKNIPIANSIVCEGASGGHTDVRALNVLIPMFLSLKKKLGYNGLIGCGGGISCPAAVKGAFAMGVDFVVTGTINQLSKESGTSDIVKSMLCKSTYSDCGFAAAADMFEQGVKLQVLKKGNLFMGRANKLYELYKTYNSVNDIPNDVKLKIEKDIFRKTLDEVWNETVTFYKKNGYDDVLAESKYNGKTKMGLIFRWYLSKSSGWAQRGESERSKDFQIWCGESIGSFNDWVSGSKLDYNTTGKFPSVVDVNIALMTV
jgi:trans-AT polyketide synthase/acyltransferase/oxidoreductase domain-containing protein